MNDFDKRELEWIRKQERIEEQRAQHRRRIIDRNLQSFDEIFEEELYNELQRIKFKDKSKLSEYFIDNDFVCNIPITLVLNDNIKSDEKEIKNIIKKKYTKELKKSDKIVVEKYYVSEFIMSYDMLVHVVTTFAEYRKWTHRYGTFSSSTDSKGIPLKDDNVCLNINKSELFKSVNVEDLLTSSKIEYKIKPTKTKCANVYKAIRKFIKQKSESRINSRSNHFLSNVNIYSFNLKRILCPVYKIRVEKFGIDEKFLINAQNKKCIKM